MRKSIWFVSAALLAGGAACNKSESEKHATEVRKAQENVAEQKQDLAKQAEDVNKEAKDVTKQGQQLTDAERRLEESRLNLQNSVKTRVIDLDAKLAMLEQRTDVVSKKLAVDLRHRRDALYARANVADSIALSSWDSYQKEIEDEVKAIESDLNKALNKDEKKAADKVD